MSRVVVLDPGCTPERHLTVNRRGRQWHLDPKGMQPASVLRSCLPSPQAFAQRQGPENLTLMSNWTSGGHFT